MNFDDEPHFGLTDDPIPPDPDAARLQKVVARGRQRLFRRRAIVGGAAGSVALMLVGSGVAVAQRNDASPQVQVQPETSTTIAPPGPAVREADMNGLHYTLILTTPVATAGAEVQVALRVTNPSARAMVRNMCPFQIAIAPASEHAVIGILGACGGGETQISGDTPYEDKATARAPTTPGAYQVVVEPDGPDVLPMALVRNSFDLQVIPSGGPVAATTSTQPAPSPEQP